MLAGIRSIPGTAVGRITSRAVASPVIMTS